MPSRRASAPIPPAARMASSSPPSRIFLPDPRGAYPVGQVRTLLCRHNANLWPRRKQFRQVLDWLRAAMPWCRNGRGGLLRAFRLRCSKRVRHRVGGSPPRNASRAPAPTAPLAASQQLAMHPLGEAATASRFCEPSASKAGAAGGESPKTPRTMAATSSAAVESTGARHAARRVPVIGVVAGFADEIADRRIEGPHPAERRVAQRIRDAAREGSRRCRSRP